MVKLKERCGYTPNYLDQQEEEVVAVYILRLRELFATWREHEPAGSAQDEMTIRDQLVLGLKPGTVQQELQRQVRRNPTKSFGEVCKEAKALEAKLKMESACASCVLVSQPQQAVTTSSLEEWREMVRAELRKEMKDQLSIIKETLAEEIKRQHQNPHRAPQLPTETQLHPLGVGFKEVAIHPPPDDSRKLLDGTNGDNPSVEAAVRLATSRDTANRRRGS